MRGRGPGPSLSACKGGGKYSDVQETMEKYIAGNEEMAKALDGAKTAEDVVAAMNKMTETTKAIAPKMKEFDAKYPELKNQENPPAELKPLMDRMMAVGMKLIETMQKIAPYLSDAKVQEAQAKLQEATALMRRAAISIRVS